MTRHPTGFTLIEVVITVALSALMLGALASLFGTFQRLYGYQQTFKNTKDATGAVVHAVEGAVLPADHVLVAHTFTEGLYTSSSTALVLELPTVDASGSVVAGRYDYVAFYATSTSAYRVVDTDAASARRAGVTKLGDYVRSLTFTYDNADMAQAKVVTVDVVASTTSRGVPVASHLSQQLRLRNF